MSGTLKLNFNGASISTDFWGWGFVLRDHNGDIVLAKAKSYLHAMKNAFEFGAHSLIVEVDCLTLINMLKSRQIHDTSIGLFIQDILSFADNFEFVSWSFIKRGGNKVVHHLAHRQPLCLEGLVWESDMPEDITSRASDDMYAYVTTISPSVILLTLGLVKSEYMQHYPCKYHYSQRG